MHLFIYIFFMLRVKIHVHTDNVLREVFIFFPRSYALGDSVVLSVAFLNYH